MVLVVLLTFLIIYSTILEIQMRGKIMNNFISIAWIVIQIFGTLSLFITVLIGLSLLSTAIDEDNGIGGPLFGFIGTFLTAGGSAVLIFAYTDGSETALTFINGYGLLIIFAVIGYIIYQRLRDSGHPSLQMI
jgi:hypothetical protein